MINSDEVGVGGGGVYDKLESEIFINLRELRGNVVKGDTKVLLG